MAKPQPSLIHSTNICCFFIGAQFCWRRKTVPVATVSYGLGTEGLLQALGVPLHFPFQLSGGIAVGGGVEERKKGWNLITYEGQGQREEPPHHNQRVWAWGLEGGISASTFPQPHL